MSLVRLPPYVEGGSLLDTSRAIAQFGPEEHGLLGWSFDPSHGQGTAIGTGGVLYLTKIKLLAAATITNVGLYVVTAGATLTANQCFASLYSASGVLLAATANQATNWTSTGLKTMALSSAQAVNSGYVYVGFYSVGTTQPAFLRGSSQAAASINVGLATPVMRYSSANTGLTTASPSTFSAQTATANAIWAAVS